MPAIYPEPAWPSSWIRPSWPAPKQVISVMTTRHGGCSRASGEGDWASLNLGDHVGDAPEQVIQNREIVSLAFGKAVVYLKQIHGVQSVWLEDQTSPGGSQQPCEADAALTTQHRLACCIMVADCLPILLTDKHARFVAAVHAGWRGLAGHEGWGVIEQSVNQAVQRLDIQPEDMMAWLGPCIGPQAFEVGEEVVMALTLAEPGDAIAFKPMAAGKWLADLALLARQRLSRQGVHALYGNDSTPIWCTYNQAQTYFSHRRSTQLGQQTGRMAALIALRD